MKTLNVDGYIVHKDDKWIYDLFEVSTVTQEDVRAFLKDADGEDIQLNIDCYGGAVWVASDMYADLRAYKGKSTANITGLSASASTVLMLGCEKVVAAPTAQFMMHLASTSTDGNRNDMMAAAAALKSVDDSIINAYELKTGLDRKTLNEIMEKATWMTVQEAKEYGFIDEITLKEGETLTKPQITAVMAMTNRIYAMAAVKPGAIQKLAKRLKNTAEEESNPLDSIFTSPNGKTYRLLADAAGDYRLGKVSNKPAADEGGIFTPKEPDNGGNSQPVTDTTQRDQFLRTKYEHMEVMSK